MPEISVIVPVYRVEPYLRRCVDSILSQTFTDFELILVDDGSPDNCGAICDEYALKDSRVRVIHKQNGGLSDARNAGIDIAQGNYLTFVDSDDWVHKSYLIALYNAIISTGCIISVCSFINVNDYIDDNNVIFNSSICDGLSLYNRNRTIATIACGKLYAQSLFSRHRYPVGKIHEDEFVTYKLLYESGNIAYINASLYYYFQNDSGITHQAYTVKKLDLVEAVEGQCQFFKAKNRSDLLVDSRKLLMNLYFKNIVSLQNVQNGNFYIPRIRRKLKIKLLFWARNLGMSPIKNKWEYSLAFPILYRIYSFLKKSITSI